MRGMPLEPTTVVSADDVVLTAMLILLVLIGFNAPHLFRMFGNFVNDIWSKRTRGNIFDDHVATESSALLLMMLLTSLLEGVLLAEWMTLQDGMPGLETVAVMISVAVVFNLFSYVACGIVGWLFASPAVSLQWRRGLNSTQAMLGVLLLLPALISLVRYQYVHQAVIMGIIMYILFRILYIIKGFRIFYTDFSSLLYFILYLCTLEIIPVVIALRIAVWLSGMI